MTSPEELIHSIKWGCDYLRGITGNPIESFQIISRIVLLKWASDNRENQMFGYNISIKISPESSWEYIQNSHMDSSNVISNALKKLVSDNPWLWKFAFNEIIERVLENHPEISTTIVDIISNLLLDVEKLPNRFVLGDVFSAINRKLVEETPNSAVVANSVTSLLMSIIKPQNSSNILDPFLGMGLMQQEAIEYILSKESSIKDLNLYGQERNNSALWISFFISLMYGILPDYKLSDAFTEPNKINENELIKADFVISMPPMGVRNWGREIVQNKNDYMRFRYGLPPSGNGDIAAIEIALSHLSDKGKCGIITATGVLFRGGSEAEIRKNIIQADLTEAIISLPGGLLFGSGIPLALIIFNKNKPAERKGKILLADYSDVKIKRSGPKELPEEISGEILNLYEEFKEKTGFARIVSMDEIASKEYNLNISGYIQKQIEIEKIEMTEAIEKIQALESERLEIVSKLMSHLKKFN